MSFYYQASRRVKYSHQFVVNLYGDLISSYQGDLFVLLSQHSKFHPSYLFTFYSYPSKILLNWRGLWIEKCDYIESFYQTIQGKYPIIDESLPYYLGMLNLAICYLNDYSSYMDYAFVQHNSIHEEDFCNPFQFRMDIKERDFGEYLKYLFFTKQYQEVSLSSLISYGSSYFNYILVFARMLYPNYYFDLFDAIILEKKNSFILNEILSRITEYEDYLKVVFHEFEKYVSMPPVYF